MVAPLLMLLMLGGAPGADTSEKAAEAPDKIICKKFLETGSLVKGTRVCKTKTEWQKARDAVRMNMSSNNAASCQVGNGGSCF